MLKIIILLIPFLVIGCASDHEKKLGEKRFFKQIGYSKDIKRFIKNIPYWVTRGDSDHCFKDNPEGNEIFTIEWGNEEYLLDHLFNRVFNVDVKIQRLHQGNYVWVNVRNTEKPKIEKATCYFNPYYPFKISGGSGLNYPTYVSLRVLD